MVQKVLDNLINQNNNIIDTESAMYHVIIFYNLVMSLWQNIILYKNSDKTFTFCMKQWTLVSTFINYFSAQMESKCMLLTKNGMNTLKKKTFFFMDYKCRISTDFT